MENNEEVPKKTELDYLEMGIKKVKKLKLIYENRIENLEKNHRYSQWSNKIKKRFFICSMIFISIFGVIMLFGLIKLAIMTFTNDGIFALEQSYIYILTGFTFLVITFGIQQSIMNNGTEPYREEIKKMKNILKGQVDINEKVKNFKLIINEIEENHTTEFKSSLQWCMNENKYNKTLIFSTLKTICAFMNSDGGNLIIGLDDDKKVIGIQKDIEKTKHKNKDGFKLLIKDLISNYISKSVVHLVEIDFKNLEDKTVSIIKVQKSINPVFLNQDNNSKFFIRSDSSSESLNPKETTEYLDSRSKN